MSSAPNKHLVLITMVFAVAMTFIDQTIVAIAIPDIQKGLGISAAACQWVVNGYLLALSALFAFGGKLGDVMGRRRMVVIGVVGFATMSALCGATPDGSIAEAWLITCRVIQGAFAALLFPASVAIVVSSFDVKERGKAMAIFFGVTGALTAIGPFLGGYLVEWTWRAIFWINIPVAIIALILIAISKPDDVKHKQPLDYPGTMLISGSMGLLVLGFQQSNSWGWASWQTIGCLVVGAILAFLFVRRELAVEWPLLQLKIFQDRGFAADNAVLALMSVVFVPFFLFASEYSQIALGENAKGAGEYILYFFIGFVIAAQIGGRILDDSGAKKSVLWGSIISAVGFFMLAGRATHLDFGEQQWPLIIAGAGVGLILGPVSTDALNRGSATAYSEITGITQTARNFGATLGLAVLGSVLIQQTQDDLVSKLGAQGVPRQDALDVANSLSSGAAASGASGGKVTEAAVHAVQSGFAEAMQVVFYGMAGVMVATYVIAHIWMVSGRAEAVEQADSAAQVAEEPSAA
jgi:EmrB/QacA subfamily drug resistance transporter